MMLAGSARRLVVTILAVALVAGVAVGCSSNHSTGGAQPAPTSTLAAGAAASTFAPPASTTGRPYWLLEDYDIAPLLNAGLSRALLEDYFNNSQTFLITHYGRARASQDSLLPDATHVSSFGSYAQMEQAFSSHAVPVGVKYILYDNENWAATPVAEQHQPFAYAAQAETLAHQHGIGLIFTPAADLAKVFDAADTNTAKYGGYLTFGFASQGARVSDVFEIQGQQDEAASDFVSFVDSAAAQARDANPKALILLGIATQAPREQVTPQLLLHAYQSTRSLVSGYWINLPGGISAGSKNGAAVGFLEALAPALGYR